MTQSDPECIRGNADDPVTIPDGRKYHKKEFVIMANTSKKKSNTPQQTWNTITGTMRVYGNTFETGKSKSKDKRTYTKWSATISGKDDNDEWVNFYINVKFVGKDSAEPETDGLHTIDIMNAFWSVNTFTNKDGDTVNSPVIVVTSNDIVE